MTKKTLSLLWTKHLKDPTKKSEFAETIKSSQTALGRLTEIIDQYIDDLVAKEANFEDPNWPYREAFLLGQRYAYKQIKHLTDLQKGK